MVERTRVEIGFDGGQVVSVRLEEGALAELRSALEGGGWRDLQADEGTLAIDLGKVVFLRSESGEHLVGFSGG